MKLVLDSNIFLAAMNKKGGFSRGLLFNIIRNPNQHQLFISPSILLELHEKSKKLIKEKFIDRLMFQRLIKIIYKKAHPVVIKEHLTVIKDDPDDDRILECAVAAQADLIISMDHHLLKLKHFRNIGIIHPRDFFYMLESK